jgi:hypothetical protein
LSLEAYEAAVSKLHDADTCLRQHASSPTAPHSDELQHAAELLEDAEVGLRDVLGFILLARVRAVTSIAEQHTPLCTWPSTCQERLKEAAVYEYHGAHHAAVEHLAAALQVS